MMEGEPAGLHCHGYELTQGPRHLEPHTTLALLRPHLQTHTAAGEGGGGLDR